MSTSNENHDVIVIGGGVIGCFTAWQLARQGQNVVLLEQFNQIPHSWGSSAGESRCIRKAYVEDGYSELMKDAYEMWTDIEKMTKLKIVWKTGMLVVDNPERKNLKPVQDKMEELGYLYTAYNSEELRRQFPTLNFKNHVGLFDYDGGVLDVHNVFKALMLLINKSGGKIHTGVKVLSISPGSVITINTNKGTYRAKKIVLTAGPWTGDVTRSLGLDLPLRVKAATVWFWKEKKLGSYSLDAGFPVFSDYNIKNWNDFVYAVPCFEYPNMLKIHMHHEIEHSISPDYRDVKVQPAVDVITKKLTAYVKEHFPDLEEQPSILQRCMTTMTPDFDFILDRHPKWHNIVIGAGFSGHGFKLSPLIGKLLADITLNNPITVNMEPFKISRFQKKVWKLSKL